MMLTEEYDPRRKPPRLTTQSPQPGGAGEHSIRNAIETDLPDVVALYRHYVRNSVVTFDEKPPTLAQFRSRFRHLQKLGYPFRVVRAPEGTLLGYAYVFPFREKSAYRKTVESSIYLGPAATGRGLGKQLLGDLISHCEAAGLKQMIAIISDQGAEASLALHTQFGFIETGRMAKVGFKFERWIGIILMQKSLRT